jgi:fructokinase
VQDTTGAGDAFIGGFLYKLLEAGAKPENLVAILKEKHEGLLEFANASGAFTAAGKGAISALPKKEQVLSFIKAHQ